MAESATRRGVGPSPTSSLVTSSIWTLGPLLSAGFLPLLRARGPEALDLPCEGSRDGSPSTPEQCAGSSRACSFHLRSTCAQGLMRAVRCARLFPAWHKAAACIGAGTSVCWLAQGGL